MDRETKEITTSGGHKIVLKTYLTAGESRTVNAAIFEGAKFRFEDGTARMEEGISGMVMNSMQDALILSLVVSLNGTADNLVERCLDLPERDFEELDKALREISNPHEEKKD